MGINQGWISKRPRRFVHITGGLAILLLLGALISCGGKQAKPVSWADQGEDVQFGGKYEDLEPVQKDLIDDWFKTFNQATGQNFESELSYNELPLSIRTTFEAVTHSLSQSTLTDEDGESLGTALDVVQAIETVHGMVPKSRGDLQFRAYVVLKPGVYDILEKSQEFKRGSDNTIFHKGYPINWRQQGKVPTLQISMSKDERRADIDVDYRSSKVPQALFNGHLTTANSDVRAGSNYDRHVNKWTGFRGWWHNLFGIPTKGTEYGDEEVLEYHIPEVPRLGKKEKLHTVMHDFLNTWLVEQRPGPAAAYLSKQSYACLSYLKESEMGEEEALITESFAIYRFLADMRRANEVLGLRPSLADYVKRVKADHPSLKVMSHPYEEQFTLVRVPEDMAETFLCQNRDVDWRDRVAEAGTGKYDKYWAAGFQLKLTADELGETVYLLWEKELKWWRIVAFQADPVDYKAPVPDTNPDRGKARAKGAPRVKGDPDFIRANHAFMNEWLVTRNYDAAFEHFSEGSYSCANLYLETEGRRLSTSQAGRRLREDLTDLEEHFPNPSGVGDVTDSAEVHHPDVKIVQHDHEDAYTLVSIPSYLGKSLDCTSALQDREFLPSEEDSMSYGDYYATAFQLDVPGEDQAVLYLVWHKNYGPWKITAFHLVTP
jgi:hypothetical protein